MHLGSSFKNCSCLAPRRQASTYRSISIKKIRPFCGIASYLQQIYKKLFTFVYILQLLADAFNQMLVNIFLHLKY